MSAYNPLTLGQPLSPSSPMQTQTQTDNSTIAHGSHGDIPTSAGATASSDLPSSEQEQDQNHVKSISAPVDSADQDRDHSETETTTSTLMGETEAQHATAEKDLHAGKHAGDAAGLPSTEHGINEKEGFQRSHHHLNSGLYKKTERTSTGTEVTNNAHTASGEKTGMAPLERKRSLPPGVSPFGGVAPEGTDAESGLRAARSREEEDERDNVREKEGPDPWAVTFEPGEKTNPKNWTVLYRWCLTAIAGLLVLNSTFASSSPSGIVTDMMEYFHFSQEVAVLTISLFVAGYCVGPILWGPLSESYGRRPIFIATFIVYTGMQVGCALSKNTASILIFRFLGGTFAAAPLTNSGALLADIWDTDHRGQAMSLFSLAPFAGPSIGPIVAGFIQVSGTNWRWVYWILTMFAGFCLAVIVIFVPETYAPKLLANKAKKLRKETGEQRWYAPLERADKHFKARVYDILCKPFVMLALEPMLLAITLYMSFVYGVVYLLFEAYPFVFIQNHGFNTGEEGLAFLGFFLGGLLCVIFFMTVIEPRYLRHAAAVAPAPPKPEKRLELCVISGWSMVIALFWFAWTSYASIHWISPVLAGTLLGVAVLGMFVSLFNYIVDVYLWAAASALAGTTIMRSAFGAAFPLFAVQMYEKLGTQWASSLLGFIALVMAPIPMILMIYGKRLRARSQFSPNKVQ